MTQRHLSVANLDGKLQSVHGKLHIYQFLVDALIEAIIPDAKDKGVQREPDEHPSKNS